LSNADRFSVQDILTHVILTMRWVFLCSWRWLSAVLKDDYGRFCQSPLSQGRLVKGRLLSDTNMGLAVGKGGTMLRTAVRDAREW
jgi:hypothetical protein